MRPRRQPARPRPPRPRLLSLARTTCRRCGERVSVAHLPLPVQHCPACAAVLIETVARL